MPQSSAMRAMRTPLRRRGSQPVRVFSVTGTPTPRRPRRAGSARPAPRRCSSAEPAMPVADLLRRAAHVDVDDLRAGVDVAARGLAPSSCGSPPAICTTRGSGSPHGPCAAAISRVCHSRDVGGQHLGRRESRRRAGGTGSGTAGRSRRPSARARAARRARSRPSFMPAAACGPGAQRSRARARAGTRRARSSRPRRRDRRAARSASTRCSGGSRPSGRRRLGRYSAGANSRRPSLVSKRSSSVTRSSGYGCARVALFWIAGAAGAACRARRWTAPSWLDVVVGERQRGSIGRPSASYTRWISGPATGHGRDGLAPVVRGLQAEHQPASNAAASP